MKKSVVSMLLTGVVGLTATLGAVSVSASDEGAELRIAAQPYPLYSSIYVAYEEGYFDEEFEAIGASYTWNEFLSGPLVNEAIAAGEADLGFMADLPAIIAKSVGQEIEVISNVAYGEKGLAVLIKEDSDIASVADLKGKKIAYATGSYAQHLLARLLDQEGLTLDDVESINLGAADQPSALAAGEVDAIVIWEQYISKLTSEGTAKVLADGTGVKRGNMITYILTSYAEEHPEVVKAYIRALNRADELIAADPETAAAVIAEDFGVDAELMLKILDHFTYTTELTEDDITEIGAVKDFSLEAGIIQSDFDIDTFINTEYLDAVSE
ncbi:MAG: aliphatic sulfonate ABC transporter substrate-binding protein [Blautia sp.]|nr:aliphatic sulfonate ABC transporter substrate-binding protein [Blautia sp.]